MNTSLTALKFWEVFPMQLFSLKDIKDHQGSDFKNRTTGIKKIVKTRQF